MASRRIEAAVTGNATNDPLVAALRQHFGHSAFRPGQREVLAEILAGRDVIVVMPTGGGKSICYQLPALLEHDPTIVVSPLIALMKDQTDALRRSGLPAAALHSNLSSEELRATAAAYAAGKLRLLYLAPERLVRPETRDLLRRRPPRRLVVDEAHCISEWGHDFRRDYLRIADVAADLAPIQLVACTATATPLVRRDIARGLGMRQARTVVHGFARPNLRLCAERSADNETRLSRLEELLDPGDGHVIVYAGTRRRATLLAERLSHRWPTVVYHADMPAAQRSAAQDRFQSGAARVAVATSAFGMGIDVATVRQVFHVALCSSLEEYYQQAGRAGRDGAPATCRVLCTPADHRLPVFFITTAHPTPETILAVHRSLCRLGCDPGSWAAVDRRWRDPAVLSLPDAAGDTVRALLRDAGLVADDGRILGGEADLRSIPHRRIAEHRRLAWQRFQTFLSYLTTTGCRHSQLMRYFGETPAAERCGDRCDVCRPDGPAPGAADGTGPRHRPTAPLDAAARARAERLQEWRRRTARARGVPAYVVLSDRTLLEVAARCPATSADLRAVPGIGLGKLALYGDVLLQLLRDPGTPGGRAR